MNCSPQKNNKSTCIIAVYKINHREVKAHLTFLQTSTGTSAVLYGSAFVCICDLILLLDAGSKYKSGT